MYIESTYEFITYEGIQFVHCFLVKYLFLDHAGTIQRVGYILPGDTEKYTKSY